MIDFAANSACLNFAVVLMSGFGSLIPTASPIIMHAMMRFEPPAIMPARFRPSMASGVEITMSAASPSRMRCAAGSGGAKTKAMPSPVALVNSGASLSMANS